MAFERAIAVDDTKKNIADTIQLENMGKMISCSLESPEVNLLRFILQLVNEKYNRIFLAQNNL